MKKDVTTDFVARLKANGRRCRQKNQSSAFLVDWPGKLSWFRAQVRNNAPWDFKNNVYRSFRKTGLTICGLRFRNDMPGNFHYGFVGAAIDFSDWLLFRAAGMAQKSAGTSRSEYHCTNGDDPVDHEFIRLGIMLYDKHGLSFSRDHLKAVLRKFKPRKCGLYVRPGRIQNV